MKLEKIRVLFLIHDLMHGGAEKVLLNLVNNMDHEKFDITVQTLFDVGVNKQFLSDKYITKHAIRRCFVEIQNILNCFHQKSYIENTSKTIMIFW